MLRTAPIRFLVYLGLGLACANVPFVIVGVLMGWPAVVLSALWLSLITTEGRSPLRLFFVAIAILMLCCLVGLPLRNVLDEGTGRPENALAFALPVFVAGVYLVARGVGARLKRSCSTLEMTLVLSCCALGILTGADVSSHGALSQDYGPALWPVGLAVGSLIVWPAVIAGALFVAAIGPRLERLTAGRTSKTPWRGAP